MRLDKEKKMNFEGDKFFGVINEEYNMKTPKLGVSTGEPTYASFS